MREPFSLLIPVYAGDDAAHFERALASATISQRRRPDQVVIVQDGPVSDALGAAIVEASEAGAEVVRLARNEGLAAALNAGLEACAHEIVARMDADDVATPERFEVQLPLLESGLDIVGSGVVEFESDEDGADRLVARRIPPLDAAAIARLLPFHDPFNHPTVVYRKSVVAAAGGYQPLGLMEDYWLWARMLQAGARGGNVGDPLVLYRVSAGAYARRGGVEQLRTELRLQRAFRSIGLTTRVQYIRNCVVRGGYRLVPEPIRRTAYRRVFARALSRRSRAAARSAVG